jgi:hypothetical protein
MVRNIYEYDTEKARHLRTKYQKTSRLERVKKLRADGAALCRLRA